MKTRKKVLFLIPSLSGGGAERVFTILLRHLDRTRFEPHLAVLQRKGAYTADVPDDVVVHDLNVRRVRFALPGIIRVIWTVRPQAVVSTLGHLNIALAMCRRFLPPGISLLVRETVIVSSLLPEETDRVRFWTWLYGHSYRRADAVICLSESMVEDMVNRFGLPRHKIVRIYNPVDIERVREQAAQAANPYSGSGPHLVAAGRLCRQKGFDVLLAAMPVILKAFPSVRLAILGEGPLRHDLEEQSRTLGLSEAVTFAGFQQNPWPYLKHADVFVLPSRYEGLPNVMLEALALGTPVVATDCPGAIREVYDVAEGMAMAPPEDPAALAEAIILMCRSARDREGRIKRVPERLSRFGLCHVVSEYSSIF